MQNMPAQIYRLGLSKLAAVLCLFSTFAACAMSDKDETARCSECNDRTLAYGEYLYTRCATCHGAGASATAVPSLHCIGSERLMNSLNRYRSDETSNAAMRNIAAELSDNDLIALDLYLKTVCDREN